MCRATRVLYVMSYMLCRCVVRCGFVFRLVGSRSGTVCLCDRGRRARLRISVDASAPERGGCSVGERTHVKLERAKLCCHWLGLTSVLRLNHALTVRQEGHQLAIRHSSCREGSRRPVRKPTTAWPEFYSKRPLVVGRPAFWTHFSCPWVGISSGRNPRKAL